MAKMVDSAKSMNLKRRRRPKYIARQHMRNFSQMSECNSGADEENEWMALGMLAFSRLALGGNVMMGDGWWVLGSGEDVDCLKSLRRLKSLRLKACREKRKSLIDEWKIPNVSSCEVLEVIDGDRRSRQANDILIYPPSSTCA